MLKIYFSGELTTQMEHPSGQWIGTDAPIDNAGKGAAFSPTDLVAASLVSCMFTVMAIYSRSRNFSLKNAYAGVKKTMHSHPRRIEALEIKLVLPAFLTEDQRKTLEKIATECPVAMSLHPEIRQEVRFIYKDL